MKWLCCGTPSTVSCAQSQLHAFWRYFGQYLSIIGSAAATRCSCVRLEVLQRALYLDLYLWTVAQYRGPHTPVPHTLVPHQRHAHTSATQTSATYSSATHTSATLATRAHQRHTNQCHIHQCHTRQWHTHQCHTHTSATYTSTAFFKLFSSGDHFYQSECSTDHPTFKCSEHMLIQEYLYF